MGSFTCIYGGITSVLCGSPSVCDPCWKGDSAIRDHRDHQSHGTRLGNSARGLGTLLSGELLGEATPLFYSVYLFVFSSYQLSRQSAFQELERNPLPSALPAAAESCLPVDEVQ
jgi:hypothetical protein